MTNITSNLVKLTDYPFLYSLVTIYLAASGQPLHYKNLDLGSFIPLIGLIGVFATTLSIVDPLGNILRFIIRSLGYRFSLFGERKLLEKFLPEKVIPPSDEHSHLRKIQVPDKFRELRYFFSLTAKALSTNWISYEIDKVVSTLYFLIVLILIFIALNSETYLNNLLQILNSTNNISIT
jgi:hypothetical protein